MTARRFATHRTLALHAVAVPAWLLMMCLVAAPATAQQMEPTPTAQAEQTRDAPRKFEVAPRGYIQLDWRGYHDWTVAPGTGRLAYGTFEVRRLRAGVDGQWRAMTFEVTVDPLDADGTLVKDAYGQWRVNRAVRVRAGQFKLPGSREYQVAARNLDFQERSALAASLAPGRDLGVMLTGELRRALEYQAGVFAGDGNGRAGRAGVTSATRVTWRVADDVQVGGSLTWGRTSSLDTDPANGLEGRSASGYRFFERVYVQGDRVRLGADAQWDAGPWRVTGEVLRARDERAKQGQEFEDLPAVAGIGWSAAVTRQFGRRQASARSRPRAFDLGVRFDALVFDDEGPATHTDSVRPRAVDVRRKSGQTLTASASWAPFRWARVITNAAVETYSESRSAPEAGRREPYWTFGTRLQFELPW
jgi:hypothetical protein